MGNEESYAYIREVKRRCPQCSHASNIIAKSNSDLKPREREALDMLMPHYAAYLQRVLAIETYDEDAVREKVACLNEYYNFMHANGLDLAFSSQGKFRPTILEEFLFLLFKDYIRDMKARKDTDGVLGCGAVKAYSNLYFKARDFGEFIKAPMIGVNEKDQDFAIYRTFDISVDGGTQMEICIPAVAMEAKTYIDKTMLDSIIATAEKLKSGNPHTRFVAVAERYDVSFSVDPAYSRIDQIYVLRKDMRKRGPWIEIDAGVVWRMFRETVCHLENSWSDIAGRLARDGVIL